MPQLPSFGNQLSVRRLQRTCTWRYYRARDSAIMATVVHTNADGTTHTHGPTSAKIVALGSVTLGGETFMIDRDGQIEVSAHALTKP